MHRRKNEKAMTEIETKTKNNATKVKKERKNNTTEDEIITDDAADGKITDRATIVNIKT